MKVYLIRHGETVDNVAGLYAGVRDSALTIHGVEQARRLGEHFAKTNNIHLTHIFASPLSRAFKTAEALLKAQGHDTAGDGGDKDTLAIVKVPDLIEQDFGYYEGRPFYARSEAKKSGREAHYERHKDDPDFVDVESKESMCKRADAFLDDHFMPLLDGQGVEDGLEVAIVSHGILLSHLWRRLLLRLPRKSLTIAPEVTAARGSIVLEHLGGWSNTGYLELAMSRDTGSAMLAAVLTDAARGAEVPDALICPTPTSPTPIAAEESAVVNPDAPSAAPSSPPRKTSTAHSPTASRRTLMGWSTHILVVDSKAHLSGLKRQRGGIGRLAHDEGQKKLTGFFKRQKKG
ncbi:hypothetical protein LTR91_007460 [Friedmanniomyces endolithicus]|uniref:Phosphoglycerate mutase-like protein n=1 Tax=Friedmanniomyces endolithicus TaxID=329885 RepID=A0AAN6KPH4_9PEZI|nr:hypothetical protein LTR94_013153 [Friedmanniomyces endolithicus]KAK0871165.1 hypothetical protein LTS02_002095 [Friedmanniomyces endolithicus]KAK0994854.1 hypothetical protein LTR91_007460 [Friedmanniomyces endolithicus]